MIDQDNYRTCYKCGKKYINQDEKIEDEIRSKGYRKLCSSCYELMTLEAIALEQSRFSELEPEEFLARILKNYQK